MNDIESVIKERQSIRDADVQRQKPSRCDEAVEWSVEVHRAGDNGDVAFPHPRGEGAASAADVEANTDVSRRAKGENFVDAVIEFTVVVEPASFFSAVKVETVLAIVGAFGFSSVYEAAVVLAGVGFPDDAGVGGNGPEAGREGGRSDVTGWGFGVAAAARERFAALKH